MFLDFFYFLRERYAMGISLREWMTLLAALEQGLHGATLTGFYQLCRITLVKRESDLDQFDQAFLDYFREAAQLDEIPAKFLRWLERPAAQNIGALSSADGQSQSGLLQ